MNSSKGIIRDKALKGESDDNIRENLQEQGVTAAKRFKVKKGHDFVDTNTILLTFNSVVPPKTLKIFYRIIPVEMYVLNPLRCFNCQRFGHHENNCPYLFTLLILDQFVNAVEREVMTITPTNVQTQQNVSTVGKIIYQGQVNVKFGKKRKKS